MENIEIPAGNSPEDIKARKLIIKNFYARWNAEHPDKQIWNDDLGDFIHIKFLSITETADKAALRPESTAAVFRLTELLQRARKVAELPVKSNSRNQKQFERMIEMRLDGIKMMVGVQRSNHDKVQYCITSIEK